MVPIKLPWTITVQLQHMSHRNHMYISWNILHYPFADMNSQREWRDYVQRYVLYAVSQAVLWWVNGNDTHLLRELSVFSRNSNYRNQFVPEGNSNVWATLCGYDKGISLLSVSKYDFGKTLYHVAFVLATVLFFNQAMSTIVWSPVKRWFRFHSNNKIIVIKLCNCVRVTIVVLS